MLKKVSMIAAAVKVDLPPLIAPDVIRYHANIGNRLMSNT